MPLENVVQYLLSGITTGSVYAIIAIGFNIIYNTTGIINFAQGEFLMLGGMISITLAQFMPLPAAIAGAVLITAGIGFLIFLQPLHQPPVASDPVGRQLGRGGSQLLGELLVHTQKGRSFPGIPEQLPDQLVVHR